MSSPSSLPRFLFAACGIWLIGLGAYFIFVRPALLPEDARYLGTGLDEIRSVLPGLEVWLDRVFTVMGGFMAGAGVLTILAAVSSALRWRWAGLALALAGLLTVGMMSVINFQIDSDFKWLLLLPAAMWFIGVVQPLVRGRVAG